MPRDGRGAGDGTSRPGASPGTLRTGPGHQDSRGSNGSGTWRPDSTACRRGSLPTPDPHGWAVRRRLRSRRDMP